MILSLVIAIEAAYFDSVMSENEAYIKLRDNIDSFEDEANIIDEAKCYLVNFGTLEGFEYDNANIYETNNGYHISYEGIEMNLKTNEQMILNVEFE